MGGGGQYPYPKEVWSPTGGWWTRPSNWRTNTFICAAGIAAASYGIWQISAAREVRHAQPTKKIPSMMWSPQAKAIGVRQE